MSVYQVRGGAPLRGEAHIHGAKNSVLPLLAASILSGGVSVLHNCPDLSDVRAALKILEHLGCRAVMEGGTITVDATDVTRCDIPDELMRAMRSSVIFLGAVLGRTGCASLNFPGGCATKRCQPPGRDGVFNSASRSLPGCCGVVQWPHYTTERRTGMDYTLLRSARKTIAVAILPDGGVEVRAPRSMPIAAIEGFLTAKRGWIEKHAAEQAARHAARCAFSVRIGDRLPLRGGEYPVVHRPGRAGFDGDCFHLPPGVDGDALRRGVAGIYRAVAKEYIPGRVAELAPRVGVVPAAVTITSAKTRWGSCSGRDRLSISWRLMMADPETIDYVVIHELAHIRHHNHSPRFWAEVARHCPNYAALRGRLRLLQDKLAAQRWE